MHPEPLLTVVIPCRDQAHFLGAALESVARQNYPRIVTVVVDDGSSDATASLAAAAGAVVLRQAPSGVSVARNHGLAAADGEYVLFLDADDELMPDAVSTAVALLEREPDAAMVARCCRLIDIAGRDLPTNCPPPASDDMYGEWLVRNLAWTPGAVVFRRAALEAIGGFPNDLGPAADYAVYLTLARTTRVLFDAREVVRYRQHETNMSRDAGRMLRAVLAVLRRERPHVPPRYIDRYKEGLRAWRTFYGEEMIQQLRSASRARRLRRRDAADAALLVRQCGPLVLKNLGRKLLRVARGLPPSEVEPGRFTHRPSFHNGQSPWTP
jgi:glycosyltransferase involved in cell wall biosynthesis